GEVPSISVDHEHAITMVFDAPVHDVVLQIGDAGHGDEAGRAVVDGGEPPGVRAAARAAGDADLLGVHLGAGFEVVERPHGVPGLDAGRRVAAGRPPPHAEPGGAVVQPLDLAELQRVQHEAAIPLAGEPGRVV